MNRKEYQESIKCVIVISFIELNEKAAEKDIPLAQKTIPNTHFNSYFSAFSE